MTFENDPQVLASTTAQQIAKALMARFDIVYHPLHKDSESSRVLASPSEVERVVLEAVYGPCATETD